jgi:hypothetical protein
MADLRRYSQHDRISDEEKLESMGKAFPPAEFHESFIWRFEGWDRNGTYFSTTHNGALYYFDFLSIVPLINVRRRGAQHYWQVDTLERGIKHMQEDYRQWQIQLAEQEQAPIPCVGERDVDDMPF